MITFITDRVVKILNLVPKMNKIDICGIAGSVESAKGTVDIEFTARYPTLFTSSSTAVVLNKLTSMLPNYNFDRSLIDHQRIEDLSLADPNFNKSGKINMILGADVYADIIMNGFIKSENNAFVAQETEIGWILSGPVGKNRIKAGQAVCMVAPTSEIDNKLQKFWEIEELAEQRVLTTDEQKYMEEMVKRGYMEECAPNGVQEIYYLPHHPVFKNSSTTKVRPVFDAGRKTTNGVSLNDMLLTGPRLQDE